MKLKGIYPVNRNIELRVETSDLGIAVLGTPKLTKEEIKTVIGALLMELKHRERVLNEVIGELEKG